MSKIPMVVAKKFSLAHLPVLVSLILLALLLTSTFITVTAHEYHEPMAMVKSERRKPFTTYLGNEGLMIVEGDSKILFDPFFDNAFNTYQLVPTDIRQAIMAGLSPYNDIDVIFISHAHGDHFSAQYMRQFLKNHPKTKLVAPQQAVDSLAKLPDTADLMAQTVAVSLDYGEKPWVYQLKNIAIDAVRIPHAGWPGRATVENIVFRVTLNDKVTVMHMGDADPDDRHFKPFKAHWEKRVTDTAYPPYWFFLSPQGNAIIDQRINAKQAVGMHVPVKVPAQLKASGKAYFSIPGEQRQITKK
jgi:L-ascorbate metabolism protein UlaG (beta-lactamase superfamily)